MSPVRESSARPAQEEPVPGTKHSRIPGDLQGALHHVKVPCYFVDRFGVIRWINHATRDLVGDVRGRQQSSVVAPEQAREARESFTRKMLGTERSTNARRSSSSARTESGPWSRSIRSPWRRGDGSSACSAWSPTATRMRRRSRIRT